MIQQDRQNGAFTKALKEVMLQRKLNRPKISVKGLDLYISERVPEFTKNKQTPESQAQDGISSSQRDEGRKFASYRQNKS